MAKQYRSAMGKLVDMDMLRIANEAEIAVGNMKTNARGDELGPGGKIVKTRAQVMAEYHQLNSTVAKDTPLGTSSKTPVVPQTVQPTQPIPVIEEENPAVPAGYVKPRGSFAEAIAEETEVTQELLDPKVLKGTDTIKRI